MRWRSFPPLGIAYEVLDGPFSGSRFFIVYEPRGSSTGVSVYGEFTSPTIPEDDLGPAVGGFFDLEFEQDRAALEAGAGGRTGTPGRNEEDGPGYPRDPSRVP